MLTLYCPDAGCWRAHVVCLFYCKKKERKKCKEYQNNLQKIMAEPIPEKYAKYGTPDYCIPKEPKVRKVRKTKAPKKEAVVPTKRVIRTLPKEEVVVESVKRKRRSKKEMEAAKSVAPVITKEVILTTDKKKRIRRTKAQMELARSQPQGDLKCAVTKKRIGKQSQSLEPPVCIAPSVEKESSRKRGVRSDKGKVRGKKKVVDKN